MRRRIINLFIFIIPFQILADEGMWIPLLLNKINIDTMQSRGLNLSAEDIYSINNASLKDAIVIFGNGCTGEIISNKGLVITNHHCGYRYIQSLSSLENNYLKDGFWAMSTEEELPNPGLNVTFLVKIEDVTNKVLDKVYDNMPNEERDSIIKNNITSITEKATENNHYTATVKSFYYGNEYYLFVYEKFKDVRLVGTPPSSIGKFGGDTDNWMWPRHTGDFSLYRIYADSNNLPAEYSPDNIPYIPKKSLSISLNGIEEGDFTWIFGYPGSTKQYITSHAIDYMINKSLPAKISIRDVKLNIIDKEMKHDPEINIQYAAKYAGISNSWKKWKGIIIGLKRLDAINIKKQQEQSFNIWANSAETLKNKYGGVLNNLERINNEIELYWQVKDYLNEIFYRNEIINFIDDNLELIEKIKINSDTIKYELISKLTKQALKFYKDYNKDIDKNIFSILSKKYYDETIFEFYPEFYREVNEKYDGNFTSFAEAIYSKTFFADSNLFFKNLNKSFSKLESDPFYKIYKAVDNLYYDELSTKYNDLYKEKNNNLRLYVKGLQEMYEDSTFYPDANFTLRVAFGNISGYEPRNAVSYNYYSTLRGVIEKTGQDIYDYKTPEKLIELYNSKDYGMYGTDSIMPVCFIATNHTSGGNSGSPVLNADGHLIGVNFDRCWEGTMSDYMFDPNMCRNISLDIRYALFIIDKFAEAGYLLDEMDIILDK